MAASPPDMPAKPEQIKSRTLPEFLRIIEVDLPTSGPTRNRGRVLDVLEAIRFPEDVIGYFYRLDNDSTGDPTFWVWVIMDDATEADGSFLQEAADVRRVDLPGCPRSRPQALALYPVSPRLGAAEHFGLGLSMTLAADLLEQARHLVRWESREPLGQASLRRGVSTAYYALFHLLIEDAAAMVVKAQGAALPSLCGSSRTAR